MRFSVFSFYAFFKNPHFPLLKVMFLKVRLFALFSSKDDLFMCFQDTVFWRVQPLFFEVFVGSWALLNRPWPSPTYRFVEARALFSKNHIFSLKNEASKKTIKLKKKTDTKTPKIPQKAKWSINYFPFIFNMFFVLPSAWPQARF